LDLMAFYNRLKYIAKCRMRVHRLNRQYVTASACWVFEMFLAAAGYGRLLPLPFRASSMATAARRSIAANATFMTKTDHQRTSQGENIIKQTSSAEAVTRIPRRGTSRKPWLQSPAPSISIFKETESSTASPFNACLDSHHFGVASYLVLAMSRREVRVLCPSQPRTGKVSCQHTIQS